tara:strand:- start:17 stop:211 length:195 start_codon:yes stop_codon:yes gene_type:complete
MSKVINKTWSIKDEGHLNKNNIIFTEKMRRLIKSLERVNQSLGYYVLNQEDKWVKIEKVEIKEN